MCNTNKSDNVPSYTKSFDKEEYPDLYKYIEETGAQTIAPEDRKLPDLKGFFIENDE